MAFQTKDEDAELPFGSDLLTLRQWKNQSTAVAEKGLQPQTFAQFLAEEQAKDRAFGRLLKRRSKIFFTTLALFQIFLVSTVAALIFTIQRKKKNQAWPLIWLIISAGCTLGVAGVAALLFKHRRDRRRALKRFADLEIEKYQREMQKSQKEAERASLHGRRIRDQYRSASRARSLRSRSRASSRSQKSEDEGKSNFGSSEVAKPKEANEKQATNQFELQPLSRDSKTFQEAMAAVITTSKEGADGTMHANGTANGAQQHRTTLDVNLPNYNQDDSNQGRQALPPPRIDSLTLRVPNGPLSSHPPSLFEARLDMETKPAPAVPPKDPSVYDLTYPSSVPPPPPPPSRAPPNQAGAALQDEPIGHGASLPARPSSQALETLSRHLASLKPSEPPPPPPPSRAPPTQPGATLRDEPIGLGLSLPTHPSSEALEALNHRLTSINPNEALNDQVSSYISSSSGASSPLSRAISRSGHGLDREQSDENLRNALEKDSDVVTLRSEDEGKGERITVWARSISGDPREDLPDSVDEDKRGRRARAGRVSKGFKSWVSEAARSRSRKAKAGYSGPALDRTDGRIVPKSTYGEPAIERNEAGDVVIRIGGGRGKSRAKSLETADVVTESAASPMSLASEIRSDEGEKRETRFEGLMAYEGT